MSETCPTFLVHGNAIKEVIFTEWEHKGGDRWEIVSGPVTIEAQQKMTVDRVIYELPTGCYEGDLVTSKNLRKGDTLTLTFNTQGPPMRQCYRHPSFEERAAEPEPQRAPILARLLSVLR